MPDRLKDIYDTLEEIQAEVGLGGGGGTTDVSALATEVTLAALGTKTTATNTALGVLNTSVAATTTAVNAVKTELLAIKDIETQNGVTLGNMAASTAFGTDFLASLDQTKLPAVTTAVESLVPYLEQMQQSLASISTSDIPETNTVLGLMKDAMDADAAVQVNTQELVNQVLGQTTATALNTDATTTAVTATGAATVVAVQTLETNVVTASGVQTLALNSATSAQTTTLGTAIGGTTTAVGAVNTTLGTIDTNITAVNTKLAADALVQSAMASDLSTISSDTSALAATLVPGLSSQLGVLDVDIMDNTVAVQAGTAVLTSIDTKISALDTKLADSLTAQEYIQASTGLLADALIPETNTTLGEIKTAVVADALVQVASKTVLDNLKTDSGVIKEDIATLVSQGTTTVSTLTALNTVTVPAITTALGSIATEVTLASVLSKLSEIELNTDSATSGANTSTLDAQLTAVNNKLAADALTQTQILNRVDNAPDAWNALNNLETLVVPAVTTAVNSVATLLTAQNTTSLPNLQTAVENVQSITNDVVTAVNETYLELQGINTTSSGSKITLDSVLLELEALNAKVNPDQALTSVTNSSVPSSITSVILALANPTRRSFSLFNNSTSVLYLTFDVTASQATAAVPIAAGGYYEMPKPLYLGDISGIWASANGNASICQGV